MTNKKTREVLCYLNLRTLWVESGISPSDIKANSPIMHHPIPRVNIHLIQALKNTNDKKTLPVGIYGLMARIQKYHELYLSESFAISCLYLPLGTTPVGLNLSQAIESIDNLCSSETASL